MNSELVIIKPENAMTAFTRLKGLDPFLEKIREEIDSFVPDLSTITTRKEIASISHKISRSKTYIDSIGKKLVAELKEKPKLIDAERRRVRDILDQWKEEVRKPLTNWENAEWQRVEKHQKNLYEFVNIKEVCQTGCESILIKDLIRQTNEITVDDSWEEFKSQGEKLRAETLVYLNDELQEKIKHETEQAELEKLRKEKVAYEAKDREEQVAKQAVQKERERVELKKSRIEEEEKIRRADIEHRRSINKEILDLMTQKGIGKATALKVITLAAQKQLGNLTVLY